MMKADSRRAMLASVGCDHNGMSVERALRLIAGAFVLLSVALGVMVNPWFLAFTAFVGANLLQSGLTDWCPMMSVLRWAGLR
jgi:hypothetical protein